EALQHGPQGIELPGVGDGGSRDLPFGEGDLADQPLMGELGQGGADSPAAHLELLGELDLEQALAGGEDAGDDGGTDRLRRLAAQQPLLHLQARQTRHVISTTTTRSLYSRAFADRAGTSAYRGRPENAIMNDCQQYPKSREVR